MKFGTCRRALMAAAGASAALSGLTACTQESAPTAVMGESARYIAEIPTGDSQNMTLGIVLAHTGADGGDVKAYATNGTNDEAWFVGSGNGGAMDLASPYSDHLTARFDGRAVTGNMTIDDRTYSFTAQAVAAPAGIYTATAGDARATWIVEPNGHMVGMMMPNSKRDREVIDQINQHQQDFKDRVQRMRLSRQMQQAPQLAFGTWQASMDDTTVTAVPVTGDMQF